MTNAEKITRYSIENQENVFKNSNTAHIPIISFQKRKSIIVTKTCCNRLFYCKK